MSCRIALSHALHKNTTQHENRAAIKKDNYDSYTGSQRPSQNTNTASIKGKMERKFQGQENVEVREDQQNDEVNKKKERKRI